MAYRSARSTRNPRAPKKAATSEDSIRATRLPASSVSRARPNRIASLVMEARAVADFEQGIILASVEIARLLFVAHKIPVEERDRLRADLLAYCERDTWAMVRLMGRLRELAARG